MYMHMHMHIYLIIYMYMSCTALGREPEVGGPPPSGEISCDQYISEIIPETMNENISEIISEIVICIYRIYPRAEKAADDYQKSRIAQQAAHT